ncbi:hypothetical protein Ab1vBOLIVR5_gp135c [Agrobacterium phage OLIVR5]|uniref:Uncharacterized protein n=1 Tax=Agrobacterium phage OLIVR5 TaxID=2723773 RepID=A0A858MTD2_9CAUD|nr:hypothetical protein KNU99_gp135 [Agrobacterium phage OLIVR5]QIW87783.1 hypothetical protein Ab1vBOLIVR5_gp135c [Agrobacterium phage OLIVR5]QIW88047.1 hypothetical protein Ab1vBOLIVR6_gp140c [Agrobacterium phage OLIVR6]
MTSCKGLSHPVLLHPPDRGRDSVWEGAIAIIPRFQALSKYVKCNFGKYFTSG